MEERRLQDKGCQQAAAEDDGLLPTDTPLPKPKPGCTANRIARLQYFLKNPTLLEGMKTLRWD